MSMPDPSRSARRLDRKLDAITAGRYTPGDFVLADAKDADMAFGLTSASNGEQLAQDGTAHWGQRHDTGRAGE